jgi:hypothetical protein
VRAAGTDREQRLAAPNQEDVLRAYASRDHSAVRHLAQRIAVREVGQRSVGPISYAFQ